ncbi:MULTISPECIES: photosystem I reaction center subunit IX [Prosthecochloris]|uniref:Photosystem I reaction center subunit IX n=1 Tax=Prosthecochloris vibrioformis TaxID=1098 RepID=A0A5C4RZC8_PROVB|nr:MULTISPECIES: photosystem I reaction center subunit IX [Prosthecochloris]ANT64058.1 Photosystem I psaA/psaB protein [Prosthecochloris sp. CIB 2401]TNJ36342.1 photosystem I reaction center subunit IX [Prosthecochloris vibrioformis]
MADQVNPAGVKPKGQVPPPKGNVPPPKGNVGKAVPGAASVIQEKDAAKMKRFLFQRTETRSTKWYQIFDTDKLDDEQVVGAHLALLGVLGFVMGIYYMSGMQVMPWGGPGFHDNWFYLTIKPRMVSLGIDTYSAKTEDLMLASTKLMAWAIFHFISGSILLFGGWRHWTHNLTNPFTGRAGNFRDFRFLGKFGDVVFQGTSAKTYKDALGPHTVYMALLFLGWGLLMWLVLGFAPVPDFQTINSETFMSFIWFVVFFALGLYWWKNPPNAAIHLNDDMKAAFSVHLTAIGYINIALGVIAFVAFQQDSFAPYYAELDKLVFYIYGEPFNRVSFDFVQEGGQIISGSKEFEEFAAYAILPKNGESFGMARVVINLIVFNHIICGVLYVFAGVYHGGQYLLKIQLNGLYSQIKSIWIAKGRDQDVQVKILGTIMALCFATMLSVYAVIVWNTICELNIFGTNIMMSFYWLKPLPILHWMFEDPSINDWVMAHVIVAGSLFSLIALARIAFFSHTSPLWDDLGLKKNSYSFPCLGPVYGGTCGVSIQDQLWFAMLWGVKGLSAVCWYIDGAWIASMMYGVPAADAKSWDAVAGLSHHYSAGIFYYFWTETVTIFSSSHLSVILMIGHLVWFISFAVWFEDRGSRLEGADIQTRTLRWLGKKFLNRDVNFRFPVLTISDSKLAGTFLYFGGTFMLVFLFIANGFYQTNTPALPPVGDAAGSSQQLLTQVVDFLMKLIA